LSTEKELNLIDVKAQLLKHLEDKSLQWKTTLGWKEVLSINLLNIKFRKSRCLWR